MPVISDLYSSKHLKCADLGGKPVTVTIKDVSVEPFQNDGDNVRKAVLHFHGNVIKPLVVNKTNYVILAHAFGPNTDTVGWEADYRLSVHDAVQGQNGGDHPRRTVAHAGGAGGQWLRRTTLHARGNRPDGSRGVEASGRQEGNRRYLSAAERRNPEVLVMMWPMSRRAVPRRVIHHRIGNNTVSLYPYAIGYARAQLADLSMSTARQGACL